MNNRLRLSTFDFVAFTNFIGRFILWENVFTSLEVQYMSDRDNQDGVKIQDHTITNITLFAKEVAPGLDLSASAYNVFNKRFFDPAGEEHEQDGIEQYRRNFRVKLTYTF